MTRQNVLLLGAHGETGGDILEGLLEDGNFVCQPMDSSPIAITNLTPLIERLRPRPTLLRLQTRRPRPRRPRHPPRNRLPLQPHRRPRHSPHPLRHPHKRHPRLQHPRSTPPRRRRRQSRHQALHPLRLCFRRSPGWYPSPPRRKGSRASAYLEEPPPVYDHRCGVLASDFFPPRSVRTVRLCAYFRIAGDIRGWGGEDIDWG